MRSGAGGRVQSARRFLRTPPGAGGPYNAASYLNTPTPDGTNEGTHVDVVHVEAGLFGWKYWMAFTPFHNSDASLENPNILVSNDGLAWQVHPSMASSQIDPTPSTGFNSDPDLLLGQDNVLYCYYRSTNETGNSGIKLRSSTDGINWSSESLMFSDSPVDMLSPTVLWDGSQYVMYGAKQGPTNDGSDDTVIMRTASAPGGPWSAITNCTYPVPSGLRGPWHIDATRIGTKTVLLVNEKRSARTLGLASTTDGTTFTVSASPVINPAVSGWDSQQLYRGCAEPHTNGTDLRVWYAAQGASGWRIGYTAVPRTLIP